MMLAMKTLELNPGRIAQAMKSRSMTADDLAFEVRRLSDGRIRANAGQISKWIKGMHVPKANVLGLIAQATGKSMDFFYGTDDDGSAADDSEEGDPG